MIPEAEIRKLREDAETLLQGTARVWLRVDSITEGGGQEHAWSPGPNLKARIAPVSRTTLLGQRIAGDLMDVRTTHVITLPWDAEVETTSQVEYGGEGLFEVTAVRGRSFDQLVQRVECVESSEPIEDVVASGLGGESLALV